MRNNQKPSKAERGGDTGRSSSQGQKLSSGGQISSRRRGAPQQDEATHSEIRDRKTPRKSRS